MMLDLPLSARLLASCPIWLPFHEKAAAARNLGEAVSLITRYGRVEGTPVNRIASHIAGPASVPIILVAADGRATQTLEGDVMCGGHFEDVSRAVFAFLNPLPHTVRSFPAPKDAPR